MKSLPDSGPIWSAWANGKALVGPLKPHSRITVQPSWWLNTTNVAGTRPPAKLPIRYFQTLANDQQEIEIPGVRMMEVDYDVDQDVATLSVQLVNNRFDPDYGSSEWQNSNGDFGRPGYLTGDRGSVSNRWGYVPNEWSGLLVRNALLRSYEGYGGQDKTLEQALADGNLVLTGIWLVDDVPIKTGQGFELQARNTGKLLVDQYLYPPLVPAGDYPMSRARFFYSSSTLTTAQVIYGTHGLPNSNYRILRIEKSLGGGYELVGTDGGVFCQPTHARVQLSINHGKPGRGHKGETQYERREIDIGDVRVGDRVVSYAQDRKTLRPSGNEVTAIHRRPYSGEMVTVRTEGGHVSQYTPEHPCIASLADAITDKFVVYLMRKGNQYRIGLAKGIRDYARDPRLGTGPRQRKCGPLGRCKEEGGDAFWVLSVHDSREDAALHEALSSHEFAVPSWQFPRPGTSRDHCMDLHAFWAKVGDNSSAAAKCLQAFGRRIESPLWWRIPGNNQVGWTLRPRIVAACNLMTGMQVLCASKAHSWGRGDRTLHLGEAEGSAVEVTREWYDGDVISLEVAKDHTYVADGIVTHNCYGPNHFQGSIDSIGLTITPGVYPSEGVTGISRSHTGDGYWLVTDTGAVYSFGDAQYHGGAGLSAPPAHPIIAIETAGTRDGYWLIGDDGGVFSFGDVDFYGSLPPLVAGAKIVDGASTPDGLGYWLVDNLGHVYSYGNANYFGGITFALGGPIVAIASSPSGNGYVMTGKDGGVYAFGDAGFYGSVPGLIPAVVLNDPVSDIVVTASGHGYWLSAEDGGVFAFGDAVFYGSLPQPDTITTTTTTDGNYLDITDIAKDIFLYAGFNLYDGGATDSVYGVVESTGIYVPDEGGNVLDATFFDKLPCQDPLTKLKEIVGYLMYVGDEGEIHWHEPNFFESGNFLPDHSHTATVPVIDERVQLTSYQVNTPDKDLRSEIIISSEDPDLGIAGTVTTSFTPSTASELRGLVRPAMWVNEAFVDSATQQTMAELIALHIYFKSRLGTVTCMGNPMIQIDDQVQILERETFETNTHYVRRIHRTHDRKAGTYSMSLTTNVLSPPGSWAVVKPTGTPEGSIVVRRP